MKIYIVFIVIAMNQLSIAQEPVIPKVIDTKISIDESEPSFVQENPKLFSNNSRGFIISWEDYRTGNVSYFAQKFDPLGNKIGNNFSVSSNHLIEINNSGFLNINRKSYDNPYMDWGTSSITMLASLYNNDNVLIRDNLELGSGIYPWCGTGWLGEGDDISVNTKGFFYGFYFGGELITYKVTNEGTILNEFSFSENLDIWTISEAAVASTENVDLVVWYNAYEYNSLLTGLYGTVLTDSTISNSIIPIVSIHDSVSHYFYENSSNLAVKTLNDSLFQIFYVSSKDNKLNYIIINEKGIVKDNLQSITYFKTPPENNNHWFYVSRFSISENKDGSFIVYSTISERGSYPNPIEYFHHRIFLFNKDGSFLSEHEKTTSSDYQFGGEPYLTSPTHFFTANEIDGNIYLKSNNIFETVDSVLINNDAKGSNEHSPKIFPLENNEFLISWENEINQYATLLNNDGKIIRAQFYFDKINIKQLNNDTYIEVWKNSLPENKMQTGFNILDSQRNIVFSETLATGSSRYTHTVIEKISDTDFIVLYTDGTGLKIRKYQDDGSKLNEVYIGHESNIKKLQIVYEEPNQLMLWWNNYAQKFNTSLETMSEKIYRYAHLYLGEDKFLVAKQEEQFLTTGTIESLEGDTITSKFIITEGSFDLKYHKISDKKFLVTFKKYSGGNKYYGKVINTEGIFEDNEFDISRDQINYMKDLTAKIINNDIIFAWSDLREGSLGFDTYYNIYKLDDITQLALDNKLIQNEFSLSQNYPNPFNPTTTISYVIPQKVKSEKVNVKLVIYNFLGQEITTLINESQGSGAYRIVFEASNLPSGIYYYSLQTQKHRITKKMILLK